MGLFGAILGIGAGLLGGLGKKSSAKKANKQRQKELNTAIALAKEAEKVPVVSTIDLVKMRDEAERAGFNPVAVLRAGLGSGFSTVTGEKAGLAAQIAGGNVPQPTQEPSSLEVLGGALSTGVSMYQDYAASVANANQQRVIQNGYIKGVNARNSPASGAMSLFAAPRVTSRGVEVVSKVPSMSSRDILPRFPDVMSNDLMGLPRTSNGLGQSKVSLDDDKIVNPFPAWMGVELPPWMHSSEAWENAFGEHGETVGGYFNAAATAGWNMYRAVVGAAREGQEFGLSLVIPPNQRVKETTSQAISRKMGGGPRMRPRY